MDEGGEKKEHERRLKGKSNGGESCSTAPQENQTEQTYLACFTEILVSVSDKRTLKI